MKKLYTIIAALFCCTAISSAQQVFGVDGINIEKFQMERVGDLINIDMELDIAEWDVHTSQVAVITPTLVNDTDSLRLQAISLYGRNRYFYYERNPELKPTSANDIAYRGKTKPSKLNYRVSVPFVEWMDGCKLTIDRTDYGCCRMPIASKEETLVKEFPLPPYIPQLIYQRPEAESVKSRELSGTAYVDFPVSRTEIYPTYRNNTYELGKITGTIDSARNDKDITITAVSIKGFASPESPYDNNTRLAKGRTEALKDYVEQMYQFGEGFITTSFEPEDWVGLEQYVEASTNLAHKGEILELIRSDIEPDRREWLIKSRYPQDYKYLLENCYPALRHSDYRIEYTIRSYTTPLEIEEIMKTAPQKLSLEEFYVLALTYEPGSEELDELFEIAVRMYPKDPIANLNAANSAITKGDYNRALRYLALVKDMPEAIYARGVMEVMREDFDTARPYLERAASLGILEAQATLDGMRDHWKISF